MSKSERNEILSKLTSMVFSAMLDDIVLDATLQSHYEVQKLNTVCDVCHTRCGSAHASISAPAPLPSRPGSPNNITQSQSQVSNASGTGTSTPTNGKPDGNFYYECLNCKRQIASNRYAPHLSSCMGVGSGNRRGASRNIVTKTKDSGRSASPPFGSDNGNISDDSKSVKGKGKSKTTRKDDAEFNLHRKRPGSPQSSPNKSKKSKTTGSPLKNSTDIMPPPLSRMPSKLRASPTTSADPAQDREGSVSMSVDNDSRVSAFTPEASPGTPSSIGSPSNSATLTNGTAKSGSVKQKTGAKAENVTPSRPPPGVQKMPDPHYMDYGGEETGSSTDSESD